MSGSFLPKGNMGSSPVLEFPILPRLLSAEEGDSRKGEGWGEGPSFHKHQGVLLEEQT